ncbi:MAG: hypothetical protein SFV22_13300 [Saprospiraceae bacterium]|nr:hypothetical protein [Saprospiraceae bacterium]
MNSSLARIVSWMGHPLLVPTYMLLLMLHINSFAFGAHYIGDQRTMVLLFYVISTTFLIPALGVSLLRPLGLIRSLTMHDKQERTGPYIITGVFYLWMFKNFSEGVVPLLYAKFVLGATIGLFLAFFINIFSKISEHAVGMGALTAMTILLAFEWPALSLSAGPMLLSINMVVVFAVLLAGLVGMARLAVGAHKPSELFQGYAAGFVAVLLANVIL